MHEHFAVHRSHPGRQASRQLRCGDPLQAVVLVGGNDLEAGSGFSCEDVNVEIREAWERRRRDTLTVEHEAAVATSDAKLASFVPVRHNPALQ